MTKKKHGRRYAAGDLVTLSVAGGPTMVVHSAKGDQVVCDWFDGKSLCRKPFHEKQLVSGVPTMSNRELARAVLDILRQGAEKNGSTDEDLQRITNIVEKNEQK
ncbi:MAG TPA: DUF2158 domain-containing protein [Hyphomicrobiaceae bacterium]|nr:DUF2158 domain-containing protein [Hyphomicrobiaceae bacterium]